MKVDGIRFPESSGIGIKPVSKEGSERLIRKAIEYAKIIIGNQFHWFTKVIL